MYAHTAHEHKPTHRHMYAMSYTLTKRTYVLILLIMCKEKNNISIGLITLELRIVYDME